MTARTSGFVEGRALTIKELPRGERPRERLKDHGASSLSAAELLGLVIGSGSGGASAVQLGHDVLTAAGGSLRRMASQPVAALTAMRGVGPARGVGDILG